MRIYPVGIVLIIILIVSIFVFTTSQTKPPENIDPNEIRYVPLGDSYTKGDGAAPGEAWPDVLVEHLQEEGVSIRLIVNPARTGWTTEDVLREELPVFEKAKPTFTTILIGSNDWAIGMNDETFRNNFVEILNRVQRILPEKSNVVILTNPDASFTPIVRGLNGSDDSRAGIQRFNAIIRDEAMKRNLTVVDLFPLSQRLKDDPNYISMDGLHPTGEGYKHWEREIYPVVYDVVMSTSHSGKRTE